MRQTERTTRTFLARGGPAGYRSALFIALAATCFVSSARAQKLDSQGRPMAPPHDRPIVERDGKTLLWAGGDPTDSEKSQWFDVTGSLIDPKTFQYGIGIDRIPSIDQPLFVDPDDDRLKRARIDDKTIVIGYAAEGEAKAYAVHVLDRHEIVNDRFGDKPIAIGW